MRSLSCVLALGSLVLFSHAAAAQSSKGDECGGWAAIAVSTDAAKDAFGFDYCKTNEAGAKQAAIRFFKQRLKQHGFEANMPYEVAASKGYVVGIYCRDEDDNAAGSVGVGSDSVEAANDALSKLGDWGISSCSVVQVRHGSINKSHIESGNWTAKLSCGAEVKSTEGAVAALNEAFESCSAEKASSCKVVDYRFVKGK